MALIEFENKPSTNTPINATNLNNNFSELGDTESTTLVLDGLTFYFDKIYKCVNVVFRNYDLDFDFNSWENKLIGTLPEKYRPKHYVVGNIYAKDINNAIVTAINLTIAPTGEVNLSNETGLQFADIGYISGNLSYVTN